MVHLRAWFLLFLFMSFHAYEALAHKVERQLPHTISLSLSDRDYLARKKEITFCVDPDWMPFEALHKGGLEGMTSDFIDLFSTHLGLPFRLIPTNSWAQSKAWAKSGKCDILPMIPITPSAQKFLSFSEPYLTYSVGIIASSELPFISDLADLAQHPVGIVKGYSTWEYVEEHFPRNQFVQVDGIEDGLLQVSSGKITAFLIAVPVAVHNIKELGLTNLKVAGHIQIKKELRIGISRQAPELTPIIAQMLASITKEEVDKIYRQWIGIPLDKPFDYSLLWKIGIPLLIVFVVILWWNRKLSRLNKEIVQREEDLKEAKNKAEQYLDIAGGIIVALDEQARVQLINRSGCALLGLEKEEIIGENWIENFVPEKERERVSDTFQSIMRGELAPVEHFENEIIDHAGTMHLVSWYNTLLTDEGGRVTGTLSSGQDVSERHMAELLSKSAMLEAEKANQAKTKFLAAASHDLRQPLQAARLFWEVLSAKQITPESQKIADHLGEAIGATNSLLDSLLDISRLEAGMVKPVLSTFPLSRLMLRLRNESSEIAKDVNVDMRVVPTRLITRSDPTLLETILRNLLSNAIKYADNGKVLFGCRRHGVTFTVEIWDNGRGIPNERLDEVFEDFVQIDNAQRDRTKGLGLGLSIVHRLCDILGHRVSVHSSEQRGTVFSVELPLITESPVYAPITEKIPINTTPNVSVLIIDDEDAIRIGLAMALESKGYETSTSSGGEYETYTEMFSDLKTPPDIIIADLRLQNGHTGIEEINYLREFFSRKIPSILLTGDIAPDRLNEVQNSGLPVLHKPINVDDIILTIESLIEAGDDQSQTNDYSASH